MTQLTFKIIIIIIIIITIYPCWHFQHAQAHQGTSGSLDTFLHISQPGNAEELYSALLTLYHEAAEKRFMSYEIALSCTVKINFVI